MGGHTRDHASYWAGLPAAPPPASESRCREPPDATSHCDRLGPGPLRAARAGLRPVFLLRDPPLSDEAGPGSARSVRAQGHVPGSKARGSERLESLSRAC